MSDLVRVKLDSGAEVSVSRDLASKHGLTVIESPATSQGRTKPAKYPVASLKRKSAAPVPEESVADMSGDGSETPIYGGESATSQEDSE